MVEHLGLVHLEEHAGDLGAGGGLDGVDERVERLAEEHALLVGGGGGELRGENRDGVRLDGLARGRGRRGEARGAGSGGTRACSGGPGRGRRPGRRDRRGRAGREPGAGAWA